MRNKLHHDAKVFWRCRSIVVSEKTNTFVKFFAQMKMTRITRLYNCVIPNQANIRGIPITPHGLIGIFISKQAKIGKGVTIFHNVTIGSNQLVDSKGFGSPLIEDDVFIDANSVIVGGITIGRGARIGAGCSVSVDVPAYSTVVNSKVRIIIK